MVRKVKRVSTKKYQLHHDKNFVLIAGGGFVLIMLMYMVTGGDFSLTNQYRHDKVQAKANQTVEKYVSIENDTYTPESITIKKGTTVTWTNKDIDLHTVVANDGSFNTGPLEQYESGSITFENIGIFEYHDQNNSEVRGSIVVE